jgi:tetratricopeptide (TPR) repeat protein
MQGSRLFILTLGLTLLAVSPVVGGLYNTAEKTVLGPPSGPPPLFRDFRDKWTELRSIAIDDPTKENILRKRYLLVAGLVPGNPNAPLTVEQRINLSAYLVRLNQLDKALGVLRNARGADANDFRLQANLATVHQLMADAAPARTKDEKTVREGHYRDALYAIKGALKAWPKEEKSWSEKHKANMAWWRQVEEYHKKLIELRRTEAVKQPIGPWKPPSSVDALFPVKFVGESGKYEAGKLAAAEKAKLPDNALEIVEQLLVWMPNDPRLAWLLGELLNARGRATFSEATQTLVEWDVESAALIFKELVEGRHYRSPELTDHLEVLRKASPPVPPPAGGRSEEKGEKDSAQRPPPSWVPPWETALGVGFLLGMVVAFLLYWQVRAFVRRPSRG